MDVDAEEREEMDVKKTEKGVVEEPEKVDVEKTERMRWRS